jgi:hypothetical protein
LAQDFTGGQASRGKWELGPDKALQSDAEEFFAKLLIPMPGAGRTMAYSFQARSLGKGWVGFGVHLLASMADTHTGYGEGESWLVWFTRDPVHFKDSPTRAQVYRSRDAVDMSLVAEAPVRINIASPNAFEIRVDPATGTIQVLVNGEAALDLAGLDLPEGGDCLVLRSLDRAEFVDFRAVAR